MTGSVLIGVCLKLNKLYPWPTALNMHSRNHYLWCIWTTAHWCFGIISCSRTCTRRNHLQPRFTADGWAEGKVGARRAISLWSGRESPKQSVAAGRPRNTRGRENWEEFGSKMLPVLNESLKTPESFESLRSLTREPGQTTQRRVDELVSSQLCLPAVEN